MTCVLEVKDLANVWTNIGTIEPIPELNIDQTVGILAALEDIVGQDSDVVTENGLGTYGLLLRDLQLVGVVKKGISAIGDLVTILSDTSIYTGKHRVNNVDDLLLNKGLQLQLIAEVIAKNLDTLRFQGVLTGDETDEELAGVAGVSAQYTPEEVADNIEKDFVGKIIGYADEAMQIMAVHAAFGAVLGVIKKADILGKVQGIGAAIVSLPTLATDTIESADVNQNVDKIVGSTRIPSVGDATTSAGAAANSVLGDASDVISKTVGSIIPRSEL